VINALVDVASRALQAAKNFLGIASPSRVFREQVGRQMGAGMAEGLRASTSHVIAEASALADAATRAASASLDVSSGNAGLARGFGGLAPSTAGAGITSTSAPLPVTIPIHIGDEVVRVVRTEIDTSNRDVRRTVRAGAGVTAG
jgi:hypothetical protein